MLILEGYLILSAIVFGLGLLGLMIRRQHVIHMMLCIELMLLAVNINFVAFSHDNGGYAGSIFVLFVLTVAAAEAAIGLAIMVLLFRNRGSIEIDHLNTLKG